MLRWALLCSLILWSSLKLRVFGVPNKSERDLFIEADYERPLVETMKHPLELVNVPEFNKENVIETVEAYGKRIGVKGEGRVLAAHRILKFKRFYEPRSIIFELATAQDKYEWIIRNKNKKITADMLDSNAPPETIFINEYLNHYLKKLVYFTKKFARSIGYEKVWVKNNVVMMARPKGDHALCVSSFDELNKFQRQWNVSLSNFFSYEEPSTRKSLWLRPK